jgi:hypothetical protein
MLPRALNVAAMLKSVLQLLSIACIAFLVFAFFSHPTPPGGVAWPYHAVFLAIPWAVFNHARRLSVALCYGFLCGLVFAWPVFVDGRTPLRAEYGTETATELYVKIVAYAVLMTLACALGFGLRRRRCRSV